MASSSVVNVFFCFHVLLVLDQTCFLLAGLHVVLDFSLLQCSPKW